MSHAVWALFYAIDDAGRDRYLEWFHGVHVPEKLARPGYTWAAHYEHAVTDAPARRGYVALFGGEATRVFFDPSPAQLRTQQDALTREMMGKRIGNRWVVYCEEWCSGAELAGHAAVAAPAMRIRCIDAAGEDERLQAWCAQEHANAVQASRGCLGLRKWLAASNAPRHALVQEFASVQAGESAAQELPAGVTEPFGPAPAAHRIWPPRP